MGKVKYTASCMVCREQTDTFKLSARDGHLDFIFTYKTFRFHEGKYIFLGLQVKVNDFLVQGEWEVQNAKNVPSDN